MTEPMARTPRGATPRPAQWAIVATLAAIVGALAGGLLMSATPAEAGTGAAGGTGVFAIAGQITAETYGLYLVDLQNRTICLYEYAARERRLWLRAARTFDADVQLDAYNTRPEPEEVSKMVAEARRLKDKPGTKKP